jgi:hypothetical protein
VAGGVAGVAEASAVETLSEAGRANAFRTEEVRA